MNSNYIVLIKEIEPILNRYGFDQYKKGRFHKKEEKYETIFQIVSYQNGYSALIQYAITYPVLEKIFKNIFNSELIYTIYLRCIGSFLEKDEDYSIIPMANLENAIRIVNDIFENYAIPFYNKNNSLKGVLQSLQSVNTFKKKQPNFVHSLRYEESIQLELFLTKLLCPQEFDHTVKKYEEYILLESQRHEKKCDQNDTYAYFKTVLSDCIQAIKDTDWDFVREKLDNM